LSSARRAGHVWTPVYCKHGILWKDPKTLIHHNQSQDIGCLPANIKHAMANTSGKKIEAVFAKLSHTSTGSVPAHSVKISSQEVQILHRKTSFDELDPGIQYMTEMQVSA
jgi:hypothetical protein